MSIIEFLIELLLTALTYVGMGSLAILVVAFVVCVTWIQAKE